MQKIEAHYRTESNAESAKAKLETLRVENVYVERIPESARSGIMEFLKKLFLDDNDESHDPQVLYGDVAEEDYEEAKRILRESEGYFSPE